MVVVRKQLGYMSKDSVMPGSETEGSGQVSGTVGKRGKGGEQSGRGGGGGKVHDKRIYQDRYMIMTATYEHPSMKIMLY